MESLGQLRSSVEEKREESARVGMITVGCFGMTDDTRKMVVMVIVAVVMVGAWSYINKAKDSRRIFRVFDFRFSCSVAASAGFAAQPRSWRRTVSIKRKV